MEPKDVLKSLRIKAELSQERLAEKVFVTRQAVSRWENGETTPNVDILQLLSQLYNVTINTLPGSPKKLICQCCGAPLDDESTSREPDGSFNEDYCKWCYTDGEFMYKSLDTLVDYLATHLSHPGWPEEKARKFFEKQLSDLDYWKQKMK